MSVLLSFCRRVASKKVAGARRCGGVALARVGAPPLPEFEEPPAWSPLSIELDDVSHQGQTLPPTFNFARYVDQSTTLRKLVELGVDLYAVERRPKLVPIVLALDFERDVAHRLEFLNEYVAADELGRFLTANPLILKRDVRLLEAAIGYLKSKKFTPDMIERIVTKNPFWLMFSAPRIDTRLGIFQNYFELSGNQLRFLATKQPKLITYNLHHLTVNRFALKEEMGFTMGQIRKLVLEKPNVLMKNQKIIINAFNYIHNKLKIPHETICKVPDLLISRTSRLKQRDTFLQTLGLAQYDPTKPKYVSLSKLVEGSDADFCFNVAKCSVSKYNTFLKSL